MSDIIDLIRRQLETLKGFQTSSTSASNEGTIADTIQTIRDNYSNFNFKQQDREIVNAHILSDEHGILCFLKSILLLKEFNAIKKECFKLLHDVIEQSKVLIQDYGSDIQAVCLLYIKRNVTAELKKASLVTLSLALEMCHGFHGEKRIDIKSLIEDLFFQLSLGSKLTATVKEEILCVIGVVAHYYPQEFYPYQERVLSMYLQELKLQMNAKAKAPNFNTVSGCLLGLKEYLYNFSVMYSEDPDNSFSIFDAAKKMISNTSKLFVCRAGLQLIESHAPQFAQFIFEDCFDLYCNLMEWVEDKNRDMQKLGRGAVVSVLKVVAEMVSNNYEEKENYCNKVFKYFMNQFRDIFLSSANSKELQIAVIGYGLFAGPCKLCLSQNEVKVMLQNVIQKCEHEFLSENSVDDKVLDLSCYVESLASIVHVTEYVPENIIFSLEKITVFQIDKFPKVPSACNFVVPKAIVRMLLSIQPKVELFVGFLSQVVYQGIVKTCSHPVVVEAEALKDKASEEDYNAYDSRSSSKIVTYKDYLYLWRNMLNVIKLKELNSLGIPLEQRHLLMECMYDELIRSSLSLLSKLDLSLNHESEKGNEEEESERSTISSDPLHGIYPKNQVDYYISINLVDFLRDLLKDTCSELFSKWVFVFGKEMIFLAAKHPYHSGFYKLISLTFSICSDIEFFKDFSCSLSQSFTVTAEINKNNEWKSFQLFSKFVREVAVRQQQFKDELLASCLQVLLVLPIEIVRHDINVLVPALESALKLGMSYLPLAGSAVSALEQWSENIPLEIIKPHYPRILPHLNSYLLASTLQDESSLAIKEKKRNINKAHKMSTKLVRKSNQMDNVIEDPALLKIQHQIIRFLGRLGENNMALLERAYQRLDDVAIAWDTLYHSHLKYSVPFVDMKPDIYFDAFLPRVMEIATKSSVRQVKVAACEALHSLVLFMIGRGSVLPEKLQEKFSMEALYKKLFPGLLELACDVEQVANQLFKPLVLQIVHWFSYSQVARTPESAIILLCLWDGVTNQQNAALRDFSAICLREFFLWSIKQSSKGEQKSAENLLNKLHSFSLHPNSFKRMGAALTFNYIYTIFREEELLVKKYTIQLLVQFVESLAIAHTDDVSLGTQKQCLDALTHLERIIVEKHKWFMKTDKDRKRPECLEEADLQSVVFWLLRQVGCIQTECRHKCMTLVGKLAPMTPGYKNATSFLLNYNRQNKNIFEDIFENVLKNFAQSQLNDQMSFKAVVFWLEALQTSMECYQWSFSKQLMLQNELHGTKNASMISTVKIFKAIEFYIEKIVKESLTTVGGNSSRIPSETFTAEEMLKFNKIKCTVLVRLFHFIVSVYDPDAKWFHEQFNKVLWNSSLWEVIMLAVVDPTYLGFDTTDPEVAVRLPLEVSTVLKKCVQRSEFKKFCSEYLQHKAEYNLLKLIPVTLQDTKSGHLQLMIGHELLIKNGIKVTDIFPELTAAEIIESFLDTVWKETVTTDGQMLKKVTLTPTAFNLAEKMLSVAYILGLRVDTIVSRLLKPPPSVDAKAHKEKGLLLFNVFAESICTFASSSPDVFVTSVTSTLNSNTFSEISILLKFVDCVACTKLLRRRNGKDVIEAFLSCWDNICTWSQSHPDTDSIYLVLSIITKLLMIDSEVAVNQTGKYSRSLFPTYLALLKRTDTSMNFVVTALEALPFFLKDFEGKATLRTCLEEMMAARFPLQSSELLAGSSAYHTYVSTIKKMLTALDLTGCDFLLELLSIFFCKENHMLEGEFKRSLARMIKTSNQSHHQKFADVIFNLLLPSSQTLSCAVSLALVDKVLLMILQNVAISPFINFFSTHIKCVMNNLKENISTVTFMKDSFLVRKVGNFKLVELMYQNLTKELLHSKDSQIVESYLGQKPNQGNELSAEIIKLSLEFKRTSYEMEPENKDYLRKLNCARYSALIAVVSCTQNELKFYNAFLFKENPIKNERIWERIIDVDVKLEFEMEIDPSSYRKDKFISIRHSLRNKSQSTEEDGDEKTDVPSSLQLLGSENLGLSSLAEDVSKFVFSTTDPVFSRQEEAEDRNTSTVKYTKSVQGEVLELEDDELNRHECMASLCCLFQHMNKEGLIPKEIQANEGPPAWLVCIIQTLEDGKTDENIKLFLGRLITNNAKILQPFAKFLIEPMLDVIILGTAGFTLNYYILDIIITLLSWAATAVPQGNGISKASEVLKFVIANCEHSRREIFRNNLEVIKTILECWKSGLVVPYKLIYDKMSDTPPESRKNALGIQLLGVVLSCDFPPYDIGDEASGRGYLSILLKNLSHKYKEVYGSAAEVIALALRNLLKDEQEVQSNAFFGKVVQHLENLKNKEDDKFLYCLNKIHVGCPAIADKFIPRLLYLYPNVYSSFKNYILEVLCSRVKDMKDAYREMKCIGLFEDLEKKSEVTQLLSLQVLVKLIPDLSCDDILHFLPGIVDIHNQPSPASRHALYQILFVLFEKYSQSTGAKEKEIARHAQETLLIGLADPDPAIRLTIDNFWSDEKRLPKGTKERLIALMKNMFSPVTEESFLQYSTFLLLERTSYSPDYKRTIFEHPLSQCSFQAFKIQTSWRKRHVAMSPLFTESMSSSSFSSSMSLNASGHEMKLRATQQNLQFAETMEVDEDVRKQGTYNWLTESSLDTYAMQDFSGDSGYGSLTNTSAKSLLIASKGDNKLSGAGLHNTKQLPKSNEKKSQKTSAWRLKRRFLKDNMQNDKDEFARQELRRQDRRKELQKDQRSQREAQVVMYRQYRSGELPDIQISNSSIIQPIQALAMHDATIAKLLFQSLLLAICNSVREDFPEGMQVFNEEIGSCFENILQNSFMYTPYVMSFCLESLNQLPDINFDIEGVFNACMGSNQQSIGILLLESKLTAGLHSEPAKKKMRTNPHVLTDESNYWMKLAELYRSVDAYDVVNGIFSLRMGHREENRKALQFESSGQYYDACLLYNNLYNETSDEQDQAEKDFWDKSVLSCLNKLCKWDDLETKVIGRFTSLEAPDLQTVWQDQYMKDVYLPYVVRSKMKKLLGGKNDQSLLTFFDTAREDEEKKIYVETHFSEELALLYIIQDKLDIAKQYSSSCLSIFLKEWKNLSPLAVEMHHANLQHLLKYVELNDFLDLMKKSKCVDTDGTGDTLKVWQKRFPNAIDSIDVWEDVVSNRHLFMSKMKEILANRIEKSDLSESFKKDSGDLVNESQEVALDFKKLTLETSVHIKLKFAENCAEHGNFPVAVETLKSIYKVSKALDGAMWSKFIEAYCSINNRRSSSVPDQKLNIVLQSCKQLIELENRCGESVSQKKLLSQTYEMLAEMFMKNEIVPSSISSDQKEKILAISEGKSDRNQVISEILDKSFSCLKNVIGTPERTGAYEESDASRKNIASAHMELANFCNRYLTSDSVHSYSPLNIPSFSEFPKVLIESLLDALKFGSQDALILFPRLLQVIESYPSCLPILKRKVSKMPCWLFMGWIDQMVALLDKPEAKAVHEIIENITLTYPNAIVYAFHLSYGSYDFSKFKDSLINKEFVEKIKSILDKQTLINDFVSALEHLSLPSLTYKDYVDKLGGLIKMKAEERDIKLCFREMCQSLFEIPDEPGNGNVPAGPIQKKFAKEMKPKVLEICGKDGSKFIGPNLQKTLDALGKLLRFARQIDQKIKNLKDASPWLSEFQQWKHSSQIEIPGQYSGKRKPLPEYHVKVAGFDEKVLVLSSITSPRRITIRGNDEKEYKILVKSGEDLRQDARIQQLFSVMNEIYANDINCAKRHLLLHTYKVIPLSNRLGIIEWVDNTTVLMDFMKDGMSETERKSFLRNGQNSAQAKFHQWLKGKMSMPVFYAALYTSKSRQDCVQKYEELVKMVPRNLLTKSFLKLSSSPEAFMVLRTKYAQSHAVVSLSQWILGIGDRHLGNFLVDTTSGREVGIDFGHAFGNATQFLPVPELLPFRLTPQYLQLMDPLGVKGIYEATMVHALSAICKKRDLLLSVMDIFIKEPTLDWKVQANRQLQAMGMDTEEKKDDWFPKQRITIARKKLEGFNPCYIIRKELELGHCTKSHFKQMEAACLGDAEFNVRARLKKSGLTVEEQVDCLIDAATDPYLLCLIYSGWNPWM